MTSLQAIRQYFQRVPKASLYELSHQLDTEPDLLRAMLSHWIRKGCLKPCEKSLACGKSCVKCNPLLVEFYEWVV